MPEGPSIRILQEEVQQFAGQKVISASGNNTIDMQRIEGKKIQSFKTWGKHLLICFEGFTVRIHLLMFGTYLINETKKLQPRLSLEFPKGELNFYTCSVRQLDGDINAHYDWSADVMNENWDPKKAKLKLDAIQKTMICDALLDQDIFSGVGNIIKNEALYRCKIHPESLVGKIPPKKLKELIDEASNYSFDFLNWKQQGTLKSHWLAHTKKKCQRCDLPLVKKQTGKKKRRSFFCTNCQNEYV